MMTKSKARAPGGLLRHLSRTDKNENVAIGASRDVTPSLAEALDELALRSATVTAKKTWFHAAANPEPGELMSEEAWVAYWAAFEGEFTLSTQPFIEVKHSKKGRDHRHRVYSLVRDDGRLASVGQNYLRNELVSRLGEVAAGHPLRPGKHHRWVVSVLSRRGVTLPAAGPATERSGPVFDQNEHQQAERLLGDDPRAFKTQIYRMYMQSGGNWHAFAALLDRDRVTVAMGTSAMLVVDERSLLRLPLARLLREEAKRAGKPIKIRSADLAAVFGRAKPLADEILAIKQRRVTQEAKRKPEEKAPGGEAETIAADIFSQRMQAALAALLEREASRAERLRSNRARKAALRRGDLDARVAAIADDLTVAVAASVVRHMQSRQGLRTTVLIIAALAAGSAIAPVLLAAAAVAVLRREQIKSERVQLRADVDESRAARTGWRFADVAGPDRARYAALVRSNLVDPAGPDAGPVLAAIGQEQASRFIAWWSYASPKQRGMVEGWGRTRHPRQRATGRKPKQRGRNGWER